MCREFCTDILYINMFQTEEGDRNVEMALAQPKNFVLKPQREGGGLCYFVLYSIL